MQQSAKQDVKHYYYILIFMFRQGFTLLYQNIVLFVGILPIISLHFRQFIRKQADALALCISLFLSFVYFLYKISSADPWLSLKVRFVSHLSGRVIPFFQRNHIHNLASVMAQRYSPSHPETALLHQFYSSDPVL